MAAPAAVYLAHRWAESCSTAICVRLLLRHRPDLRGQEGNSPAVRGQAQGFLVLVTYGVGMLIGAQVAGNVYNRFLGGAPTLGLDQWSQFWLLPAAFAAVVLVFFALAFRDRAVERDEAPPPTPADKVPAA
jgi:hypothetical protein